MFLRPLLICAAGVLALELLAVNAAPIRPVDIPKGWSVSESVGTHYLLGYDQREKAYFIENIGPIGLVGEAAKAETVRSSGSHHVPYSATGLKATDPWTAALLQSVTAAPYHNRTLHFEAEVKASRFKGKFYLLLRADDPDEGGISNSTNCITLGEEWQTVTVEIEDIQASDKSTLAFGFIQQGEGRVLIRNIKLSDLDPLPKEPEDPPVWNMFDLPPVAAHPVNVELRR